jgi:hypothetical protein
MTMIDPATGWFEIVQIPNKRADVLSNLLEMTWLTRYPFPQKCICDRGTEFMAEVKETLARKRIWCHSQQNHNTQSTSKCDCRKNPSNDWKHDRNIHDERDFDNLNTIPGLLSAVAFAVRATVHTTLNATPSQLVFGCDAILNMDFEADWALIKIRKQKIIQLNNSRENAKCKPHLYTVGNKIMIKNDPQQKYGKQAYSGPSTILQVNDNGTVRYQKD